VLPLAACILRFHLILNSSTPLFFYIIFLRRNIFYELYSCWHATICYVNILVPNFSFLNVSIIYLASYSPKTGDIFLCQTGSWSLVTSAIVSHFSALFISRQCNCPCSISLPDHHNISRHSCDKYPQRKFCLSVLLRLPLIILPLRFILLSNSPKQYWVRTLYSHTETKLSHRELR